MMLTVVNAFFCMIHDNVLALFVAVLLFLLFQFRSKPCGHCQGHPSCLPSLQVPYRLNQNVDDLIVKSSFAR